MFVSKCPVCGGKLHRDTRPVTFTHLDQTLVVEQPGLFCDECGDGVLEPSDLTITREAQQALINASERNARNNTLRLDEAFDNKVQRAAERHKQNRAAIATCKTREAAQASLPEPKDNNIALAMIEAAFTALMNEIQQQEVTNYPRTIHQAIERLVQLDKMQDRMDKEARKAMIALFERGSSKV